jgi:hypothetical protein
MTSTLKLYSPTGETLAVLMIQDVFTIEIDGRPVLLPSSVGAMVWQDAPDAKLSNCPHPQSAKSIEYGTNGKSVMVCNKCCEVISA